jgi:hypothetical protein
MGTALTTYSKSKREGRSRDLAPTTPPGCRCIFDNDSTFKERIFVDKNNPNLLHDVITVHDRALTRPWTADKTYRRSPEKYPSFSNTSCLEGTAYVTIGKEFYLVTPDGFLMPTAKGQLPPDTRYFPQSQK